MFQLYRGGQFYLWKKRSNTDLAQVIDKRYHIMLHRVHLAWLGFELTTKDVNQNVYSLTLVIYTPGEYFTFLSQIKRTIRSLYGQTMKTTYHLYKKQQHIYIKRTTTIVIGEMDIPYRSTSYTVLGLACTIEKHTNKFARRPQ